MVQITTAEITSVQLWESFLSHSPEAGFLQSWYWGEFHRRLDQTVIPLGLLVNHQLSGVSLCIVERAKRASYLTIAAGPLLDWSQTSIATAWLGAIRRIAQRESCAFIRVRPQLLENADSRTLFLQLGFTQAPIHLHAQLTHELDITKPENELLANMRKSARYEIRKSQTDHIEVTVSDNPQDIDGFHALQAETARRQGFVPFSLPFLKNQFTVFAENGLALLYSSYLKKALLAQAFTIFYGPVAVYHYGASTALGRVHPGAYAIQWQAICDAKKRGIKRYNFWGVAPAGDNTHRFAALSTFKRGFGGVDVAYLPAHDLVINPVKYAINHGIETFRKTIRRL
ncbi:hypothetical protein A2154_00480 [Candidatus Gottesmanbacteria bacterium RBG_16_43_7]|uniref:BioF2-like acetyltransferase domain-containing protein n=1 Tax=Candidatus Gottesmanbacteria bacterium RBG_16_43_7 TaxID=1798373 RepID=A0A1F5Z8V7_9BACT|nr:MAG: hypothetical protein A2154_00480 [Candidatus Gottesmanbacteria bacterium RBG_16_43_7]